MVYPGVLQRIKTDFTAESAEGIHAETGVAIYEFFQPRQGESAEECHPYSVASTCICPNVLSG
jgi:hypothetical protein